LLKVGKLLFHFGIQRFQANDFFRKTRDAAARENVHSKIYGDRAGVKKIERPKIQGTTGEINPAGRVRNDSSRRRQYYSVKNWAI
jgi:hypothetical protein